MRVSEIFSDLHNSTNVADVSSRKAGPRDRTSQHECPIHYFALSLRVKHARRVYAGDVFSDRPTYCGIVKPQWLPQVEWSGPAGLQQTRLPRSCRLSLHVATLINRLSPKVMILPAIWRHALLCGVLREFRKRLVASECAAYGRVGLG